MGGSRLATLCLVAGALILALVTARGETAIPGTLGDVELDRGTGARMSGGPAELPPSGVAGDITDELELIRAMGLIVVLILFLVALSVFLRTVRRRRRRRRRLGLGTTTEEEPIGPATGLPARLRAAAEQASAELAAHRGGPPGDAVVAAWLRLEQAAATIGAGREPHQTPTEFTVALLASHTTDEAALDELRGLYQLARFGPPGALDHADVAAAGRAIERVLRFDQPVSSS